MGNLIRKMLKENDFEWFEEPLQTKYFMATPEILEVGMEIFVNGGEIDEATNEYTRSWDMEKGTIISIRPWNGNDIILVKFNNWEDLEEYNIVKGSDPLWRGFEDSCTGNKCWSFMRDNKKFILDKEINFLIPNPRYKEKLKEEVIRKKIHMDLPNSVLKMNEIFKENGYELYVVGGAVRDLLYGSEPKDFDLATNAKPEEIKSILNMYRTIELGEQFGIVNVVTEDGQYEIATFRKDIGKGRRPDSVEFTTIDQDVKRRDLTINALFYDIDKGEVVDLVGGIGDIEKNMVRTVGSAVERFDEDKLRVLRALRFAARVSSEVDKDIENAISKDKTTISGNGLPISQERIRDEFLKGIKQAQSVGYLTQLITKYNLWDWVFGRLVVTTEPLVETKEATVLIAILLRSNDPTLVEKTLINSLKYTVDEVREISFLIRFFQYEKEVYKLRERFEAIGVSDETLRTFTNLMKIPNKIVDTFLNYKITTSGEELMKQGFKGRDIGQEKERIEKEKFLKLMNENKKRVSYSGIVLNEKSRELLKTYIPYPKEWEFIAHHMTINMGPLKEEYKPLLGQSFDLLVTHIGQTDKVVAVKVESEIKTQNKTPHITIAVNRVEGGKPVMSNDITEWTPIYPFEVEGKIEEIYS